MGNTRPQGPAEEKFSLTIILPGTVPKITLFYDNKTKVLESKRQSRGTEWQTQQLPAVPLTHQLLRSSVRPGSGRPWAAPHLTGKTPTVTPSNTLPLRTPTPALPAGSARNPVRRSRGRAVPQAAGSNRFQPVSRRPRPRLQLSPGSDAGGGSVRARFSQGEGLTGSARGEGKSVRKGSVKSGVRDGGVCSGREIAICNVAAPGEEQGKARGGGRGREGLWGTGCNPFSLSPALLGGR